MNFAITADPSIVTTRVRVRGGALPTSVIGVTCPRPGSLFGETSAFTTPAGIVGRGRDAQTYVRPIAKATLMGQRAWGPPV